MRSALAIALVLMVTIAGGIAAAQPGPAEGPPEDIAEFVDTQPLDENQTTPDSVAGKIRVESEYVNDTTVEIDRNDPLNFTMTVDVTAADATNVTFYIQTDAMEASQNISGMIAYLDGEETDFYVDEDAGPGDSPWVKVEIPHFSERTLVFEQTSEDISPGPVRGQARNVVAFAETAELGEDQVQPANLSGKIRVSAEYAAEMNVSLIENSSTQTKISMSHPNATNVSFYIQEQAMASTQNMEQLQLYVDGEQKTFGNSTEDGQGWVNYNVDQFSDRTATFTTGGGLIDVGWITLERIIVGGSAVALLLVLGLFFWRGGSSEPDGYR